MYSTVAIRCCARAVLVAAAFVFAAESQAQAKPADAGSTGSVVHRDAPVSSPVVARGRGEAPAQASHGTTESATTQTTSSVRMAAAVTSPPQSAAAPKTWRYDSDALARLAWDDGLQACVSDGRLTARVRTVLVERDETTSGPVMEFHVDPLTTGSGYVIRYDADSGQRLDD